MFSHTLKKIGETGDEARYLYYTVFSPAKIEEGIILGGASVHIKDFGSTPIPLQRQISTEGMGAPYPLSMLGRTLVYITYMDTSLFNLLLISRSSFFSRGGLSQSSMWCQTVATPPMINRMAWLMQRTSTDICNVMTNT